MVETNHHSWQAIQLGEKHADSYCDHLMRLDDEGRRFRFFHDAPDYMLAMHAGAAVSDGRFVVGCESDGELRGAGELVRSLRDSSRAELAVDVEREWRRRGVAAKLLQTMIDEAQRIGLAQVEMEIMPENLAMQNLARRFGFDLHEEDETVFATIHLAPPNLQAA